MVHEVEVQMTTDTTSRPRSSIAAKPDSALRLCTSNVAKSLVAYIIATASMAILAACDSTHEHIAPAVNESDSLPFMTAHGISNLISDSGIISYKIVAEDWLIYEVPKPRWSFLKGLFMEKFDSTFHVEWHVQSDTAYCHDNRIWELRGRVVILNREGTLFRSEELFWDMDEHQMWSTLFMSIKKPDSDQMLEGYNFRSDETMTNYRIYNSNGFTPVEEHSDEPAQPDFGSAATADSASAQPSRRPSQADAYRDAAPTSTHTQPIQQQ